MIFSLTQILLIACGQSTWLPNAIADQTGASDAKQQLQQIFDEIKKDKSAGVSQACQGDAPAVTTSVIPRMSSYRNLVLSGKWDESLSNTSAGTGCYDYIKKYYRAGKTFKSKRLSDISQPLGREKFRGQFRNVLGNFYFFHYTNSVEMLSQFHPEEKDRKKAHQLAIAENAYEKMMMFFKTNPNWAYARRAIYVAGDPDSSADYGKLRIKFRLSPEAKIVSANDFEKSYEEMATLNPGLREACPKDNLRSYLDGKWAEIYPLIAEDSGVDLVIYTNPAQISWYQIFNPQIIRQTDLCDSNCKHQK